MWAGAPLEKRIEQLEQEIASLRQEAQRQTDKALMEKTPSKGDQGKKERDRQASTHTLEKAVHQKEGAELKGGASTLTQLSEGMGVADEGEEKDFSQAEALYTQGMILINQKKLQQARVIFDELSEKYKDAPQFILSKYWLGEINLSLKDYPQASIAYGEAYAGYKAKLEAKETVPKEVHYRAVESLAKLSYCLGRLKQKAEACLSLKEFEKESKDLPRNVHLYAQSLRSHFGCRKK